MNVMNKIKLQMLGITLSLMTAPMAQAAETLKMNEYTDLAPGVTLTIPEGVEVDRPAGDGATKTAFLVDARKLGTVKFKGLEAFVTSFQMDIVANHVDWLHIYGSALGLKPQKLRTTRNEKGMVVGVGEFVSPKYPKQPLDVFVLFAGDRGYFIQGKNTRSKPVAQGVASRMELDATPWGELETPRTLDFGSKRFNTNAAFFVKGADTGPMKAALITNAPEVKDSNIVMTVKTELLTGHKANAALFENELKSANLEFRKIRENPTETVYQARNTDAGTNFVGFITTVGKSSVSLIVPSVQTNVNAWLSGKYYYSLAVKGLQD